MKLDLTIDGRDEQIEITPAGFRVGEGEIREVSAQSVEPGIWSVLLDGRSYDARVSGNTVTVCGRRFDIEVRDPRRWRRGSGAAGAGGKQQVSAPMPGKVVRVLAAVGDTVEAGQGIVVVEAMKMQNEMKAARAGKIVTLFASVGATVAAGEVLAVIE